MKKQFLSVLLVLCMVLSMLPPEAVAAESTSFDEPRVTGLAVSCDGESSVDLLSGQPEISMPVGGKPVFTVTFDNIELLNKVFVSSTKDGDTKYLEATLQNGQYVTDGYFDSADPNYIPGTIAVTYSKKTIKVSEDGNIGDTDISTLKTQLTAQGVSCRNETAGSDGTVTAQIVLDSTFGAMADVYFDAAVSEFWAQSGVDQSALNKWLGVYQDLAQLSSYDLKNSNGKQFTLYLGDGKDFGDPDTYLVLVKDASSNKYTKTLLQKAAGLASLGDISDALSAANIASKKLLEYRAISKDTAALREEIEAHPTMTQQEKAEANEKITALDHDKKLFLIGMTAVSLLTAPVGTPLMITALMAGYSTAADYFWERRVGMIRGCEPINGAFAGGGTIALTEEKAKDYQDAWITNGVITCSGKYYLAEDIENDGFFVGWDTSIAVNATIDLNGHNCGQFYVTAGSTLHIYDSKYVANSSENRGLIQSVVVEERSSVHIENCMIGKSSNWCLDAREGSEVTISSGIINGTIDIDDAETVLNITGGVCNGALRNKGTLRVTGGIMSHITCSSNAKADIANATISAISNNGTFNITSGTIGTVSNSGVMEIGGGTFITVDANTSGIQNTGELTIVGGKIFSEGHAIYNNGGNLVVNGGTIESNSNCLYINGGKVAVNGGTIRALKDDSGIYFTGLNDGELYIDDGTVSGSDGIRWLRGTVTISGGRIIGTNSGLRFGGQWKPQLLMAIQSNTEIEIAGSSKAINSSGSSIEICAAKGYTGNVAYYNSEAAQGVKMTIQETKAIDYSRQYMRLVAVGSDPGPNCPHSYTSVVTSPTCTKRGYTTYTCSKCGDIYQSDYIDALGHNYGEWIIATSPTASAAGQRERTCSRCGYKETAVFPDWSYDGVSQMVTISGTIPEDEQVLIARYGPNGRFLGLEIVTRSKTADVSGNKEILLAWVNKNTHIPLCAAKRIFQ